MELAKLLRINREKSQKERIQAIQLILTPITEAYSEYLDGHRQFSNDQLNYVRFQMHELNRQIQIILNENLC